MSRMIINNIKDFEPNDTFLFITLEDDIYKLMRRVSSIFGNFRAETVKKLYKRGFESLKAAKHINTETMAKQKFIKILEKMFSLAILKTTDKKINICIKHSNENSFSPGDVSKFIDRLKVEGNNVKAVFLDYVDVMTTTIDRYKNGNDYERHGAIVQELRNLSKYHKIPVVTATQNSKASENLQGAMSNQLVGDSYRKVRYSDFIYMCRMMSHLSVFDPEVQRWVFSSDQYRDRDFTVLKPEIVNIEQQLRDDLVPFELKITKSKDAGKDKSAYLLFCNKNLKIYNNTSEYIQEMNSLNTKSNTIDKDIDRLINDSVNDIYDKNLLDGDFHDFETIEESPEPSIEIDKDFQIPLDEFLEAPSFEALH